MTKPHHTDEQALRLRLGKTEIVVATTPNSTEAAQAFVLALRNLDSSASLILNPLEYPQEPRSSEYPQEITVLFCDLGKIDSPTSEFLQAVAQHNIPVLVVTASPAVDLEFGPLARQLQVDEIIRHPQTPRELIQAVHSRLCDIDHGNWP